MSKLPSSSISKKKLFYNSDTPELTEHISRIVQMKHFVTRYGCNHLKIKAVNFWPSTGKITIDGGPKIDRNGGDALIELLAEMYPPRIAHKIDIDKQALACSQADEAGPVAIEFGCFLHEEDDETYDKIDANTNDTGKNFDGDRF